MFRGVIRHQHAGEHGQALPMFALCLVLTIASVGLSVDVGRFVWARTQIQSAVDAAALAAAGSMPDTSQAATKATYYWNDNSGFIQSQGNNVAFGVTYPPGNKAVQVEASADIPTWFAWVVGWNSWHVSASGEAQSQVLDIALVLDISGSMCWDSYPWVDSGAYIGPGVNTTTLTAAIAAGGGSSITINVNSVTKFNSTSASTNNTNFGYNTTTRYYQYTPSGGRRGLIKIDNEIFLITALNTGSNTLTVTRSQTNNFTGTATTKDAHSSGAEVWVQTANCVKASKLSTGPYEPFDTTISISQYFTTLFNPTYDKFGFATFSTQGSIVRGLTTDFAQVRADMGAINNPAGGTNSARGLAMGRQALDGSGKRANAVRVLVFVTDGRANAWCSPTSYSPSAYDGSCSSTGSGTDGNATAVAHALSEAQRAANGQVVIYTIGLGKYVDDAFLTQIAAAGGGAYYKAPTTAQLDDAFKAIAAQSHVALTQ